MKQVKIARGKYRTHKCHARTRGIEFLFTFEEWVECWENALSGQWLKRRGSRKGKYVMARKGDKGPYAPWNVDIIKHEENSRQMMANGSMPVGEARKHTKLNRVQVIEIFYSKESYPQIGRRYGVSREYAYGIKHKHSWKHVLRDL